MALGDPGIDEVGPKIAGRLNESGIHTFAALAVADVGAIRQVLEDAGPRYRMHDPGTWPQQAGLAAQGLWDELDALQDTLSGGR